MMNKLLVICGPTATGKTALALSLAKKFDGELVSADSRQIYVGMDIGTGKDLPANPKIHGSPISVRYDQKKYELKQFDFAGIPVWLYDIINPDEQFSVAHYQRLASVVISDIFKRKKLPILVGGTGLYIQSVLKGFDTVDIAPNATLRASLSAKSVSELQQELQKRWPDVYARLNHSDKHNPRRLIRKIEIYSQGSKQKTQKPISYDAFVVGLTAPTDILYGRIDARVQKRVQVGVISEVANLIARGYSWDLPAMSGLGYPQWKSYMTAGKNNEEQLKAEIIQKWQFDEHAYARRQMTWFKKMPAVFWFDVSKPLFASEVTAEVGKWYTPNRV